MSILTRRTVAALVASFSLLAVPGFATPGRTAGDNINLVQALRAGGLGPVDIQGIPTDPQM